jgi:hypothetical protein
MNIVCTPICFSLIVHVMISVTHFKSLRRQSGFVESDLRIDNFNEGHNRLKNQFGMKCASTAIRQLEQTSTPLHEVFIPLMQTSRAQK